MNILQLLPKLDVGGVETGTVDISRELVKRGHKVIVVSGGGKMVKDLITANVKHIELAVHKKSPLAIVKNIKKLEEIIRLEHVDIVHSRSRVPNIIAFFASRHTQARFVTTAHGYYSTHFLSRITGWADFVIVASSVMGRHMIRDFGVPRERVRFIPRGVDLDRFIFREPSVFLKEYTIGVIGRITPIKGHAFFLQSIARVMRIMPKVKALIIGNAPQDKPEYITKLKSLVKQLNIEKSVDFFGARDDVPQIMSKLDLLVLPSVGQEAFGRVIIEAGASGVPVVATRVGGAMEVVEDGKTGLLVRPGDILEMVEAIVKLLKDRELAKSLAVEARKKVEREYILAKMVDKTLKVYEDTKKKKNILIIKIRAIGDVILVIPSLRLLRNHFSDARITVLVGHESRHVLKRCPYIDDMIICDRNGSHKGIRGIFKISAVLRQKNFDIAIDFQNNKTSHLLSWLGAIPQRFGYDNGKWSFFLNKRIKQIKIKTSPLDEQFRILKALGIDTAGASRHLEIWPSKEDFLYIDSLLKDAWVSDSQVLIGMNIGSSPRWETKRWPVECFAKLADMLAERDIRVVIVGSKEIEGLTDKFLRMTHSKPVNAVGMTPSITHLAALMKRCKLFITGDSAPMHIASSMATPFIAFFGPTDPARHTETSPYITIIRKALKCSPCYRPRCRKHRCMEDISVEEVFKAAMEKIGIREE